MNNEQNILVTLYDASGEQLLLCALKLRGNTLSEDELRYYGEPEYCKKISSLLPLHLQGDIIVKVEHIFEVVDHTK